MRPDKKKKPYKGKGNQQTTEKSNEVKETPQTEKQVQVQNSPTTSEQNSVNSCPPLGDGISLPKEEDKVDTKQESAASESKTYSKRQVFSNWERYAEPVRDDQENLDDEDGVDFSKLLQLPSSGDGYFKFKSEKIEPPSSGALFALDLKMLTEKLRTIPFYQQLDIPESHFSSAEIAAMEKEAKEQFIDQPALPADSHSLIRSPESCNIDLSSPKSEEAHKELKFKSASSTLVLSDVNPILTDIKCAQIETDKSQYNILPIQPNVESLPAPITSVAETLKPITSSVEAPKEQRERRLRKSDPPNSSTQSKLNEDLKQLNALLGDEATLSERSTSAPKPEDKSESAQRPIQTKITKPKEDLESWLDSVLDD